MFIRCLAVLSIIFAIQVSCAAASDKPDASWPGFRGPNGNGITNQKLTLLSSPKRLWTASVGKGNASMIVSSGNPGKLYTVGRPSRDLRLSCLNAITGEVIWEKDFPAHGAESSPTLEGDRLYLLVTQNPSYALCVSARDGSVIWRTEMPQPPEHRHYTHAGSPVIYKNKVLLNAGTGVALNKADGMVVWKHEGLPGLATPVVYMNGKRPAVLIFAGKALFSREIETGEQIWAQRWKTNIAVNACDPIYHDGKVFISTTYGKHAAVFDVTGSEPRQLWKDDGSSFSSGFLHEGNLYHFAGGHFNCVKFDTGERLSRGPHAGGGSAILVDGKVILLSDQGRLRIAPLSTISLETIIDEQVHTGTTWTPPSLVDGKLYVRNRSGEIVCVQIGDPIN